MLEIRTSGSGYSSDTEKASSSQTGRSIEQYVLSLGFTNKIDLLKQLPRGAKLLDLGSGDGFFGEGDIF